MSSGLKLAAWWSVFAIALLLTSAVIYLKVPGSALPRLSVYAAPPALFDPKDGGSHVVVTFRLDQPALHPFEVSYELTGGAELGRDYEKAGPPGKPVTLPIGEREATLVLRQKAAPRPTGDQPLRDEAATVLVTLKPIKGFELDPTASRLELPITVKRLGPPPEPYLVTLSSSSDGFASSDKVAVVFQIDRKPTETVLLRYRLQGSARERADYIVSGALDGPFVQFLPGRDRAELVLERRRGTDVVRGLGNREVIVGFELDRARFLPGERTEVRLVVPDPKSELSWSVDVPRPLDRRDPGMARLRLALSAPRSERVTLRYTATPDPGLGCAPAPAGGNLTMTLSPGELSAEQIFQFAPDDLVGGPPQKVHFRAVDISPRDVGDPTALSPCEIVVADDRPLPGRSLVLVVLTADLARSSQGVLDELKKVESRNRSQFVGGSLYLLTGDRKIYRFQPEAAALKGRVPFAQDAYYEEILTTAVAGVRSCFGGRSSEKSQTILLWQDFTEGKVPTGEPFPGFLGDVTWCLYWIGSRESTLAGLLETRFPPRDGTQCFHSFQQPQGLAGTLNREIQTAR
jgi:hypothetical protein